MRSLDESSRTINLIISSTSLYPFFFLFLFKKEGKCTETSIDVLHVEVSISQRKERALMSLSIHGVLQRTIHYLFI